jgi:hypothetical protein
MGFFSCLLTQRPVDRSQFPLHQVSGYGGPSTLIGCQIQTEILGRLWSRVRVQTHYRVCGTIEFDVRGLALSQPRLRACIGYVNSTAICLAFLLTVWNSITGGFNLFHHNESLIRFWCFPYILLFANTSRCIGFPCHFTKNGETSARSSNPCFFCLIFHVGIHLHKDNL